ncbi:MAG: hypothetical protein WD178_06560 [Actinomycetota bacterium]
MADDKFPKDWSALPLRSRRRIRLRAAMGWPLESREAKLAARFARFQQSRRLFRFFWLWFPPVLAGALVGGLYSHPVVLGAAVALGIQAVLAHRNLKRLARVTRRS